jgi:hypothetical protein
VKDGQFKGVNLEISHTDKPSSALSVRLEDRAKGVFIKSSKN